MKRYFLDKQFPLCFTASGNNLYKESLSINDLPLIPSVILFAISIQQTIHPYIYVFTTKSDIKKPAIQKYSGLSLISPHRSLLPGHLCPVCLHMILIFVDQLRGGHQPYPLSCRPVITASRASAVYFAPRNRRCRSIISDLLCLRHPRSA